MPLRRRSSFSLRAPIKRVMNKRGNPESLVASHPGNQNAVKNGVHSSRLIQARAAEIASELTLSFEFSPAERLAVQEAARCIAILEAIDRDFDERGLGVRLPVGHRVRDVDVDDALELLRHFRPPLSRTACLDLRPRSSSLGNRGRIYIAWSG